jgi:hypothetical protein
MSESFILIAGGTLTEGVLKKPEKVSTTMLTKKLLEEKKSIEEIAEIRGLTIGTIIGHIDQIKRDFPNFNLEYLKPDDKIIKMVEKHLPKSAGKLSYLKTMLKKDGLDVSFEDIKLARAFIPNDFTL